MSPATRSGPVLFSHVDDSKDPSRRLVAFAHSRRGTVDDLLAAIRPTPYDVADVVVRRTLVAELVEKAPDIVVIDDSLIDFDAKRLCGDVRRSVGSRILVLTNDERRTCRRRAVDGGRDRGRGPRA